MSTLQPSKSTKIVSNPFMAANAAAAAAAEPSDAAPTNVVAKPVLVQRGPRDCTCDINVFVNIVRVTSALSVVSCGVVGGWAVYQAYRIDHKLNGDVPVDNAYFLGLMGLYYCLFGILALLAEIRTPWLRRTMLHPFGFLTMYFGRGAFYIIIGSILVPLPIDSNLTSGYKYMPAMAGGIILMIMGFLQILISIFVRKVRKCASLLCCCFSTTAQEDVGMFSHDLVSPALLVSASVRVFENLWTRYL